MEACSTSELKRLRKAASVRWYLRYGLSYRDVEELLAERGIDVDHVTVFRWVQRFPPLLADAARFTRHSPGGRWFVDETYVKVNGMRRYVYRALDQHGQVIDVLLSRRRDAAAARRFFIRAFPTFQGDTERGGHRRRAGSTPRCSTSCCQRLGTMSGSTRTIRSKRITASSNAG